MAELNSVVEIPKVLLEKCSTRSLQRVLPHTEQHFRVCKNIFIGSVSPGLQIVGKIRIDGKVRVKAVNLPKDTLMIFEKAQT